jgi:trimethylamine--corrinoid protein Co-methyltransferase
MRGGALDTAARASRISTQRLEAYEPPAIDDGIRAELEEYVNRRRTELGD